MLYTVLYYTALQAHLLACHHQSLDDYIFNNNNNHNIQNNGGGQYILKTINWNCNGTSNSSSSNTSNVEFREGDPHSQRIVKNNNNVMGLGLGLGFSSKSVALNATNNTSTNNTIGTTATTNNISTMKMGVEDRRKFNKGMSQRKSYE